LPLISEEERIARKQPVLLLLFCQYSIKKAAQQGKGIPVAKRLLEECCVREVVVLLNLLARHF
jgi:hypothetical protein